MLEGLDTSGIQAPHGPPWTGMAFGLVRATMGRGEDQRAAEHLFRARTMGVELLGAYHYLRADSGGEEQAAVFWRRAQQLEGTTGTDLALAVDVEDRFAPAQPWPVDLYRAILEEFLLTMARLTSRPCVLYIGPDYANKLKPGPRALSCLLWISDWRARPSPELPHGFTDWQIWQYAGGMVDRNRYRGTAADWRAAFLADLARPPLPYDELGPVVTAVRAAEGRAEGVESFTAHDEGPEIG